MKVCFRNSNTFRYIEINEINKNLVIIHNKLVIIQSFSNFSKI